MTPTPNPWIAYRKPRPDARLRLFCFPYAGGAASVYRTWADGLPTDVEVCPVQPPGREARIREQPVTTTADMVRAAAEGLAGELDRGPYALFGHSLGAVTAFELARLRRDAGKPEPVHLFASGRAAPTVPDLDEPIHDLPAERFRERLRDLNGTPAEVLEHPELMELVEPLLRADFQVVETYRYEAAQPLTCPITALGGLADDHVPADRIEPWKDVTTGPYRQHMLPGDHFFLNGPARDDVLHIVARALVG